ncbi:MAG: transglycosylase domain-containing protein, partial [Clostridia bacterium]|nr:transglycosylase domain-containing protein [Clostridia bacterium]
RAAKFYFNKKVKDLDVGEIAMLVGVINAPSFYDPITKQEKAEKRKNTILKVMRNSKLINDAEYSKSAKTKENIVKSGSKQANLHISCVLDDACDKLKVNKNQLKNMGVSIYTSIDKNLSDSISAAVFNGDFLVVNSDEKAEKKGVLVVDNRTKNVVCMVSNSGISLKKMKRQPGSTIKPILVYAPAFEDGKLYPESIIVDEPISANGYSPSNANKRFLGAVSVREAVEKSLNVPAVKTLSNIGIKRAKKFAQNMGINFNEKDTNLALALGGMTDGVTIKNLADAYSTFASGGLYKESGFVDKILDKNKNVLYEKNSTSERVMSEATAYLVTDVLKGVVSNGTAKRLSGFDFDLASKTGTVGRVGSNKNTDAFSVVYTSEHTIVSWVGAGSSGEMDSCINGSTYPTIINKAVLNLLYKDGKPQNFDMPNSVVYRDIDVRSLASNKVELAGNSTKMRYKKPALFNIKLLPDIISDNSAHKTKLQIDIKKGEKPLLKFETKEENVYYLYKKDLLSNQESVVYKVCG